jgi:hypothetical protein
MIVTFAYTNRREFEDDIEKALIKSLDVNTFLFEMDVADLGPVNSVNPIPLKWDLLDGRKFSIKTRSRKKQTIRTKPDLVLSGGSLKRDVIDYKTLLDRWFNAHSRWIKTDDIVGTSGKNLLVKVIPTHDELVFEKLENTSFLVFTTIEVETAQAT